MQAAKDTVSETTGGREKNEDYQGRNQQTKETTPLTIRAPQRVTHVTEKLETGEGPGATQAPLEDSSPRWAPSKGHSSRSYAVNSPQIHSEMHRRGCQLPDMATRRPPRTRRPTTTLIPVGRTLCPDANLGHRTPSGTTVLELRSPMTPWPTPVKGQPAAKYTHDDKSPHAFTACYKEGDPVCGQPRPPTHKPGRVLPLLELPGNTDAPTSVARRAHFQWHYAALGPTLGSRRRQRALWRSDTGS